MVTDTLLPLDATEAAVLAVDGCIPHLRTAPHTPEEAADVLALAVREGLSVSPRGGGTHLAIGHPPMRCDVILETRHMAGVVSHTPEEMTATVLAGTPLDEMQSVFAQHGQWLALDPPHHPASTLGGLLAVNASGPHRFRYGTARDLVLGMRVAYPERRPFIAKSGARVVKSVAGYDIHKLHIGALGTLGLILDLHVRLHPLPTMQVFTCLGLNTAADAATVAASLVHQPLQLGALELLNAASLARLSALLGEALPQSPFSIVAVCEGHPRVVRRQLDEVARSAQLVGAGCAELSLPDFWSANRALAALGSPVDGDRSTVLMCGVPLSHTSHAVALLTEYLGASDQDTLITAHLGTGAIVAMAQLPSEHIARMVESARAAVLPLGGHIIVQRCPLDAKRGLDIWGMRESVVLMRRLRDSLDPERVLNPGRFVQGSDPLTAIDWAEKESIPS